MSSSNDIKVKIKNMAGIKKTDFSAIKKKFSQEATFKPDRFFDWVYIDLDHTYEGTKEILELSESKVKSEGFIAGHDYTANESFGVIQAVDEFCIKRNWTIKYLTTEQHKYFSYILSKGTT